MLYQIVKESDGRYWKQEMQWDAEYGFVGTHNPEQCDSVPAGSQEIYDKLLEWEPCGDDTHVLKAWFCGA